MRTFGIDFDVEPLKGGSPDDLDWRRTSIDTIAMTGESLMWHLFFIFVLHIFRVDPPPLSQGAIPASHGLKPFIGAWVRTIVHGHLVRRPPKYWLPSRRGLTRFFPRFFFFFLNESRFKNKFQRTSLSFPTSLKSKVLLRSSFSTTYSLVEVFLRHSNSSTNNSFSNIILIWLCNREQQGLTFFYTFRCDFTVWSCQFHALRSHLISVTSKSTFRKLTLKLAFKEWLRI